MKRKENYREREKKTSKANRKHCWCVLLHWKELAEKSFLKSTTNASEKSDPHGESLVVKRRKWLAYLTTCIKQPLAACPNKQSIVTRWRRTTTTTPASLFLPNRTRICQACRHRLIVQAIRCAGLTVEANGEGTGKYWTGVGNWSGSALARGRLGSARLKSSVCVSVVPGTTTTGGVDHGDRQRSRPVFGCNVRSCGNGTNLLASFVLTVLFPLHQPTLHARCSSCATTTTTTTTTTATTKTALWKAPPHSNGRLGSFPRQRSNPFYNKHHHHHHHHHYHYPKQAMIQIITS